MPSSTCDCLTDPRAPWQHDANENALGLLRRYLPRNHDIASPTEAVTAEQPEAWPPTGKAPSSRMLTKASFPILNHEAAGVGLIASAQDRVGSVVCPGIAPA